MKERQRIRKAIARLDSAEGHLIFQLTEKKRHYTKFGLTSTLSAIRDARTLIKNIDELQDIELKKRDIQIKIEELKKELQELSI